MERNTTYAERLTIVAFCLEHDKNYKATAKEFNVSCRQVRSWMKNFLAKGLSGLVDECNKTVAKQELSQLRRMKTPGVVIIR